ncbi:hypothetical protein phiA829_075 [Aeromonas phage phiA8-29]|uniref:Uncharacterized protein n=1 Tax=Aeromonas phage phiA8-29 TaxID=1978922 RepID=A0A1W6DYB9_9CAUD|nr:hypothetical protein HWB15_gp076 [Aeromonas phage phiA8-29]ARK07895.1 hypothetical protein phiA829_075 [Aeromonas phage phiA8-29]
MECSCGASIATTSDILSTEEALKAFPGQRVNIPKDQAEIMIRYGSCVCGRLSFWANPIKPKAKTGVLRFFKPR